MSDPAAPRPWSGPIVAGTLLAMGAAVSFGVTPPILQRLGAGVGSFGVAALLYAGAAGLAALTRGTDRAASVTAADLPRVALLALFGAFAAPVLLAVGLKHSSGASASLMLNLESVLTVGLGWAVHKEGVGARVWLAAGVIALGGALLALDRGATGFGVDVGLIAVAGATFFWALDNTLSRPLSQRDPASVVVAKGALGALASGLVAVAVGEAIPPAGPAAGILLCGALGYGGSLRLYLLAQRTLGSARTGSVFAIAPFVGALTAVALGDPLGGLATVAGGLCMALGVVLHLTESHDHEHAHPALTHTHAHRHDDGHHDDHRHDGLAVGAVHTHAHTHAPRTHAHAHGEDLHHQHH
jgi:drug/metabolite transporter (DMT)-like permease